MYAILNSKLRANFNALGRKYVLRRASAVVHQEQLRQDHALLKWNITSLSDGFLVLFNYSRLIKLVTNLSLQNTHE